MSADRRPVGRRRRDVLLDRLWSRYTPVRAHSGNVVHFLDFGRGRLAHGYETTLCGLVNATNVEPATNRRLPVCKLCTTRLPGDLRPWEADR